MGKNRNQGYGWTLPAAKNGDPARRGNPCFSFTKIEVVHSSQIVKSHYPQKLIGSGKSLIRCMEGNPVASNYPTYRVNPRFY